MRDTTRQRVSGGPRIDDRYDLVWFWKQNDSGLYGRRTDLLAAHLAASPRVRRVVCFDRAVAPRELLGGVALDRRPLAHHANLVLARSLARVVPWPHRRKLSRHLFLYGDAARGGIERFLPDRRRYARYVAWILRRAGVGSARTVFWVYPRNPSFPGMVRRFAPDLVVADCVDDQRAFPGATAAYVAATDENYRRILGEADLVLANCRGMADALAEHRRDITVLESGYEAPAPPRPCPRDLARLRRPIVGYAGNLADRIDVALLRRVAEAHPEWSLVLIGSAHGGREIDALDGLANVHRLGVRPYPRVRDYVRHFDVALVPHRDDALTRTMAPLKLGLYCAEGVPVVATRIANLGALAEVIEVADGADAFVAAIERALAVPLSEERVRRRAEILAAGAWPKRAAEVLALLDAAWGRRTIRKPA